MIYTNSIYTKNIKTGYHNMYNLFNRFSANEEFLINLPISFAPPTNDTYTNSIKITMWETTKLKLDDVLLLNKHKVIFVPSKSLKKVFIDSGVTRPIEIFDGFIDDQYTYAPHIKKDKLIFGMGFNKSLSRKNEIKTINYFLETFNSVDDVELWIKTNVNLNIEKNDKIKLFYDVFVEEQMHDWYSNIDVFITLSKGEGIGMFNLESMSVGRPIIANPFLTINDYLNNENGYCLDYDLIEPEDKFFFECGFWADSKKESVINTLKYVYNNRDEIKQKGIIASKSVEKYKASLSVPRLINQLKAYV